MAFTNIRKPQGSLLRIRMFAHKFHIWNKFKHMWNYRHIFKSFQNQIFSGKPCTACRTASWCQLIFWFILIVLAGALHSWKWLELNAWKPEGERQLDLIRTLSCSFRSQSSSRLGGFGVAYFIQVLMVPYPQEQHHIATRGLGGEMCGNLACHATSKNFRSRIDFLRGQQRLLDGTLWCRRRARSQQADPFAKH